MLNINLNLFCAFNYKTLMQIVFCLCICVETLEKVTVVNISGLYMPYVHTACFSLTHAWWMH